MGKERDFRLAPSSSGVLQGVKSMPERWANLKGQLQSKLDVAVVGRSLRDVPERPGLKGCAGVHEIRMIEDVKHLRPELHFEPLLNGDVLEYREIGIHKSRTVQDISPGITESVKRGSSESGQIGINAVDEVPR